MKPKPRIKVIADKPAPGQTSIAHLIGQEFEVVAIGYKEAPTKNNRSRQVRDGTVSVIDPSGDRISLQPGEYRVL